MSTRHSTSSSCTKPDLISGPITRAAQPRHDACVHTPPTTKPVAVDARRFGGARHQPRGPRGVNDLGLRHHANSPLPAAFRARRFRSPTSRRHHDRVGASGHFGARQALVTSRGAWHLSQRPGAAGWLDQAPTSTGHRSASSRWTAELVQGRREPCPSSSTPASPRRSTPTRSSSTASSSSTRASRPRLDVVASSSRAEQGGRRATSPGAGEVPAEGDGSPPSRCTAARTPPTVTA